jgi:arginine decarboxylase
MNNLAQTRVHLLDQLAKNVDSKKNLELLNTFEYLWAYPGADTIYQLGLHLDGGDNAAFSLLANNVYQAVKGKTYLQQEFVPFYTNLGNLDKPSTELLINNNSTQKTTTSKYFEVLIIHPLAKDFESIYRGSLSNYKNNKQNLLYDLVLVDNPQDAIIAILANPTIQTCVYLDGAMGNSEINPNLIESYKGYLELLPEDASVADLQQIMEMLRPEIDHIYVATDIPEKEIQQNFHHVVYTSSYEFYAELDYHILSGINQRQDAPFFNALCSYSTKPKLNFHALPVSQCQSLKDSPWMDDVIDFYGSEIFNAETSSTMGGMDSLMDPKGSICQAQSKAAQLFQSQKTFFVTNGTTSANKIVMQANLRPDDIVLISADCHKSIPYSILLVGANPIFLETYPLEKYDLYGCVTLDRIVQVLLDLKEQGQLDKVKQITLTNSTFDGLIYNVEEYMTTILAIKPDIIFHWDEAWFSFASFNPLYLKKTAMHVAKKLSEKTERDYTVRVYATQSVHKTLSAFRQASMLHVYDELFEPSDFYEAYRTHTSTSPNYQIIASLDFARRQMSLEGYSLVQNSLDLAKQLRARIAQSEYLKKYFKVLSGSDLIPDELAGDKPQIFLDPTRVTLDISATGIDGWNFRQLLMTQYDIQINKTSRNTILFIINIGTKQHGVDYLVQALEQIVHNLSASHQYSTKSASVHLPQNRQYHKMFVPVESKNDKNFQAVNIRQAYYAGLSKEKTSFKYLDNELIQQVLSEKQVISAGFVTPYPPGFPIIVPGQIITYDILLYLQGIRISEIHGYNVDQGLKVFTEDFLKE